MENDIKKNHYYVDFLNSYSWHYLNAENIFLLKVKETIGQAIKHIGTYNELDNTQQVVAYIDPEMCINCGEYAYCSYISYSSLLFLFDQGVLYSSSS